MKVVSYYNVVPEVNKSQEKFDILTKFITGVNAVGDIGILHKENNIIESDVGVIQGWQHTQGKGGPHLQLRQQVIDTQIRSGNSVCAADANLFLYANNSNKPHGSEVGIFKDKSEYFSIFVLFFKHSKHKKVFST